MDLPSFKEAEGECEFRVEVDILSRLDHANLVSLIGYCADGKNRFLVYEFMRNGNLILSSIIISNQEGHFPLEPDISISDALFENGSFLNIKCLRLCNNKRTKMLSVFTIL